MTSSGKRWFESGVQGVIDRALRFFDQGQWHLDVAGLPRFRAIGVRVTRVLSLAWHGMVQNDCLTRASGLTYITVLSLVPLLAFAFSVAKGFGAYERLVETTINPFLDSLDPAPAAGAALATEGGAQEIRSVVEGLLNFVGNTNFANLGLLGLVLLMFTSLKLMTTIEGTFNVIWGVPQARPLLRKVTDFVALVVVTPILLLIATTVSVSLQSNVVTEFMTDSLGLGLLVQLASRLVPLVMVCFGFAFLFMIMPNTRVPLLSALVGGVVGGTIWQAVQILHIQFQLGVASYNAIYAGFAAFPLFLVWVYMNWVAVLLGGLVAWAHQTEPAYRDQKRVKATSPADRELLALRALSLIAASFSEGRGPAETGTVAAQLGIPPGVLQDVLRSLVDTGLIAHTADEDTQGFLPAQPLTATRVETVLRALRGERHERAGQRDAVAEVLDRLEGALESSPDNLTLMELVERGASERRPLAADATTA